MQKTEFWSRLEAMERRADGMQTVARILLSQVEAQRREIAGLKAAATQEANPERVEAPSLASMLRAKPG
jgi:hypothetical protein